MSRNSTLGSQVFCLSVFLFTFFSVSSIHSTALDAPHDSAGCTTCHDMTAYDQPNLIPGVTTYSGVDIDDTKYNSICWGCHNGVDAPAAQTHSSIQTDASYGDWTVECVVCHNQHKQEQDRKYGTNHGKFIRTTINLAGVKDDLGNSLKSGRKTVRFIGNIGSGSFADGDATYDGICEVCHTQTGHWSDQGLLPDNKHFAGLRCLDCHPHDRGMKPAPPDHDTLVSEPAFCGGCHTNTLFGLHLASENGWVNCDRCHDTNDNYALSGGLPLYLGSSLSYDATKEKKVLTSGQARCDDCHHGQYNEHVVDTGHGEVHNNARLGYDSDDDDVNDGYIGCGACHYEDIVQEHSRGRAITCTTCHESGSAKVLAAITKGKPAADGGLDRFVFCDECHNTSAGMPAGNLVDKHHLTPLAANGDCTRCHVVGRGIDGPVRGPCGDCHGDSRYAYRHAKASMLNLDNVKDYRVCFSCHLEGAQGYKADPEGDPPGDPEYTGTPVVVPFHRMPEKNSEKGHYYVLYPGDLWVSDQCPDNGDGGSCNPDTTRAIANLPPCVKYKASSQQCDNFVAMAADPQTFIADYNLNYEPDLTQIQKDAILALSKIQPGFGLYDRLFAELYQYTRDPYPVYYWFYEPGDNTSGTIMDVAPYGSNRQQWGNRVLRFLVNRYETHLQNSTLPHVTVPITYNDGSGTVQYQVVSRDGTGGGGWRAGTGGLQVQISPPEVAAAGARWRQDGLSWQDSGDTLSGLTPREHIVEFSKVAGWVTPQTAVVTVNHNETATLSGDAATYTACPQNPAISINGSSAITWDEPGSSKDYSASGWYAGTITWTLDTGGATGFELETMGSAGARIRKTGATAEGTYNFMLTATGSDCYGNFNQFPITVTVTSAGAAAPAAQNIGKIYSEIDRFRLSKFGGFYSTIHVGGDLFARVNACGPDCTGGAKGTLQTFRIDASGMFIDSDPDPDVDNPVIHTLDLGFTDSNIGYNFRYQNRILHVVNDLFVIAQGREIKTVRIDTATGVSAPVSSINIDSSSIVKSSIFAGPGNIFIVPYGDSVHDYYLRTLQISVDGQMSWASDPLRVGNLKVNPYTVPTVLHVTGDMYVMAHNVGYQAFLHTFTVNSSGNITNPMVDSFAFGTIPQPKTNWCNVLLKLFRLGDSNYFGVTYKNADRNAELGTVHIADNGTITKSVINTMYLEVIQNVDGADIIHIGDNVYGFLVLRDSDMINDYSLGDSSRGDRVILQTYHLENGRVTPARTGYFKRSWSGLVQPEIIHVTGNIYLVSANSFDHGLLFTISIESDPDGDNIHAMMDNCQDISNSDQADSDADGLGDACDTCPSDPENDIDMDFICGDADSSPGDEQNDSDGDGICAGSGYGGTKTGDGDNCPDTANADQADSDSDGVGDVCDVCPDDPENDADADGICESFDTCPQDPDNDSDGDGICGDIDNCPADANADQADSDCDGVGDACSGAPVYNPPQSLSVTPLSSSELKISWDDTLFAEDGFMLDWKSETCLPELTPPAPLLSLYKEDSFTNGLDSYTWSGRADLQTVSDTILPINVSDGSGSGSINSVDGKIRLHTVANEIGDGGLNSTQMELADPGVVIPRDFDIQVDYSLPFGTISTTQPVVYARLHVRLQDTGGNANDIYIERNRTDYTVAITVNGVLESGTIATTDSSGKLRIVRRAGRLGGYYWDGSDWVRLLEHSQVLTTNVAPVRAAVEQFAHRDESGGQAITTDLDNFRFNTFLNRKTPILAMDLDESAWTGHPDEVKDSAADANHGTSHGGVYTITDPERGTVGSFDGVDDYVEISGSGILENVTDTSFTFAAWVKPETVPPRTEPNPPANDYIYAIMGRTGWHVALEYIPGSSADVGKFQMAVVNDAATPVTYATASLDEYPPGTWHHVVGVVDDTAKTVSIFVDGQYKNSRIYSGNIRDYGALPYYIGAMPGPAYTFHFDGLIDDVRIFDSALSAVEISDLYNNTLEVIHSGLSPNSPYCYTVYPFKSGGCPNWPNHAATAGNTTLP